MGLTEKSQITLPDGRTLGFALYGAVRGKPILYFHGFPSSRLEARFAHDLGLEYGARIIAVDRPGYGLSDYLPERTILDWPKDILQLGDALGIDRFRVMAVSGGGPYALACARSIPNRIRSVGIACGLGPMDVQEAGEGMVFLNRFGLFLGKRAPGIVRGLFALVAGAIFFSPGAVVDFIAAHLPDPDRQVLRLTDIRRLLADSFRESIRAGPKGPAHDILLYSRPWGFDLKEIEKDVYLWYGEKDAIVPPGMGRYLSEQIPRARLTLYPIDGHFSLVVSRLKDLVGALIE